MNYGRLVAAAVVATIVDAIYGFLVYGTALTSQFARFPGVYRTADQATYMPILFCGVFLAMLAATLIFAKGYEGGSALGEGIRFGILIGLAEVGYGAIIAYAITNIGRRLALSLAIANFVEWVISGAVIGLVYGSAARAVRHRAATA
jgi:hypothetical protein